MKNKAILAMKNNTKAVKCGKWLYTGTELYFGLYLVARRFDSEIATYPRRLQDCNFEYPTFHAIDKAIKFLNN